MQRSLWIQDEKTKRLESPGPTKPELSGINALIAKNPFTFFSDPDKAEEYIDMLNKVISLSGGEEIESFPGFYIANSDNIKRWNEFIQTLKTNSTNGILNLGAIGVKKGPQWLVKTDVSSQADPVMYEYYIGRRLNKLRQFIPNFSLTYGGFQCSVNLYQRPDRPELKRLEEWCSPPSQEGRFYDKRVPKQFIVSELVSPATQLSEHASKRSGLSVALALIQVLCAMEFAQKEEQFTHYDLHASNVLMQELPGSSTVFLYNLGDTVMVVPAEAIWIVIDFGRSHIKDTPPNVRDMWPPFDRVFDSYGIKPRQPNKIWDMTRLLFATMGSSRDYRLQKIRQTLEDDLKRSGCKVDQNGYVSTDSCKNQINSPLKLANLISAAFGSEIKAMVKNAKNFVWYGYDLSNEAKRAFMNQITQQQQQPRKTIRERQQQPNQSQAQAKVLKELEQLKRAKEAKQVPELIQIGIEDKTTKLNDDFEKSIQRRRIKAEENRRRDIQTFKEFVTRQKETGVQQMNISDGRINDDLDRMDQIEQMELASSGMMMTGGGGVDEEEPGTTCLYIDGRLLQREEIEETLKQLSGWEPDFEYLDDSQLCNALLDKISEQK